jgi:hypothetical protein
VCAIASVTIRRHLSGGGSGRRGRGCLVRPGRTAGDCDPEWKPLRFPVLGAVFGMVGLPRSDQLQR